MSATSPRNPSRRTRNGKIARLPFKVRDNICRMIRDGRTAKQINDWLVAQGVPGTPFSDVNFTSWRKGGYLDWLQEEERNDEIRARSETIRRKLEAGGLSVIDEGIYELAQILTDAARERPDDAERVASAIVGLKLAVVSDGKLELDQKKVEQREAALALQRDKFRWSLAEKIIKFAQDAKVQQIVGKAGATQEQKIRALLSYMDEVEKDGLTGS